VSCTGTAGHFQDDNIIVAELPHAISPAWILNAGFRGDTGYLKAAAAKTQHLWHEGQAIQKPLGIKRRKDLLPTFHFYPNAGTQVLTISCHRQTPLFT
jgi:hypothetical protein